MSQNAAVQNPPAPGNGNNGAPPPAPPSNGNPPPPAPPAPPAAPPSDAKIKELQDALRERDTKIQDLENTNATIQQRLHGNQPPPPANGAPPSDAETEKRIQSVMEKSITDPAGAAAELKQILNDVTTNASRQAVSQAQRVLSSEKVLSDLRTGVKSSYKDFDEETVDLVLERANNMAASNPKMFKSPKEFVDAAAKAIHEKLEGYAQKRNQAPPLPPAANAENGNNPPPAPPAPAEVVQSGEQWIEGQNAKRSKKIL